MRWFFSWVRSRSLRRWVPIGVATVGSIVLALVIAMAAMPEFRDRVYGDTVEARIDDYLSAVMRDDRAAALETWRLDGGRAVDDPAGPAERREQVTSELIASDVYRYTIDDFDWWRTCCEPGLIDDRRNAGLGRAYVRVNRMDSGPEYYVMDVVICDASCGDGAGLLPRRWTLRDVYPAGEEPLYAKFADPVLWYPDVFDAVRKYYDRFAEAQAACDLASFEEDYPHVKQPGPQGSGINWEGRLFGQRCEYMKSVRYDLEGYEPMRLDVGLGQMHVRVHGIEWWEYRSGGDGGGEFLTTISFRLGPDGWAIDKTDEVTLPEYHEQH